MNVDHRSSLGCRDGYAVAGSIEAMTLVIVQGLCY
jgi:hypothetical protein